jgi:hypothetical protein
MSTRESAPTSSFAKAGLIGNAIVLGTLGVAAALHGFAPDSYYAAVQEDEALEWATFWVFVLAAVAHAGAARRSFEQGRRIPWFLTGVGLFCLFVALEEISWGQRLLGYRPPAYFLEHNFQQELNVHNVLADDLRQAAFLAVVLGYGALLPFAFLQPRLRALGQGVGLVAPSLLFAPAFLVTGGVYHLYPWTHTGEWCELTLGTAMLFVALHHVRPGGGAILASSALTAALGVGTAATWWAIAESDPERVEVARVELAALRKDVSAARTRTRCGIHKRLYSLMEAYGQHHLLDGEFASLRAKGLPEERADFFLDPWNSPYWVRHVCSDDRTQRAIYVYSFGPNRKRDSLAWEIVEDDLAGWVSRPRVIPGP